MLLPEKVVEIERLLAAGVLSLRDVALTVGVSRATVRMIASHRRPDYEALRREKAAALGKPVEPAKRCAGCGGLVYRPAACAAPER